MSGRGLHPEIRTGEGRAAWTAFASLCGITSGHALLETGRDALFLARLPASALPSVYLALAFLSAGVFWLRLRLMTARRFIPCDRETAFANGPAQRVSQINALIGPCTGDLLSTSKWRTP